MVRQLGQFFDPTGWGCIGAINREDNKRALAYFTRATELDEIRSGMGPDGPLLLAKKVLGLGRE
jgi:hypothetical protein